jgi:hypothetical protein
MPKQNTNIKVGTNYETYLRKAWRKQKFRRRNSGKTEIHGERQSTNT